MTDRPAEYTSYRGANRIRAEITEDSASNRTESQREITQSEYVIRRSDLEHGWN